MSDNLYKLPKKPPVKYIKELNKVKSKAVSERYKNGFMVSYGVQGSGKTVWLVKLLKTHLDKRTVFSNITLRGIKYIPLTILSEKDRQLVREGKLNMNDRIDLILALEQDPHYFDNSIMILDEIHLYADSLNMHGVNNRVLQGFISQIRKRNILLLASTQFVMHFDVRIRRQVKYWFEMENLEEGSFMVTTLKMTSNKDIYYPDKILTMVEVDLQDYFKYYDTTELVN